MPRKRYSPEQIIAHLREAEVLLAKGQTTGEACRYLDIAEQTHYRWRKEFGGLGIDQAKRLEALEMENAKLKKPVADQALDLAILKEGMRLWPIPGISRA
jgi:putative transposase